MFSDPAPFATLAMALVVGRASTMRLVGVAPNTALVAGAYAVAGARCVWKMVSTSFSSWTERACLRPTIGCEQRVMVAWRETGGGGGACASAGQPLTEALREDGEQQRTKLAQWRYVRAGTRSLLRYLDAYARTASLILAGTTSLAGYVGENWRGKQDQSADRRARQPRSSPRPV